MWTLVDRNHNDTPACPNVPKHAGSFMSKCCTSNFLGITWTKSVCIGDATDSDGCRCGQTSWCPKSCYVYDPQSRYFHSWFLYTQQCHQTWLGNPRTKWIFDEKIIEVNGYVPARHVWLPQSIYVIYSLGSSEGDWRLIQINSGDQSSVVDSAWSSPITE